ncbi:hypothetical protein B6U83_04410 [Thermoplasmatales archaeon ex4484_36]|nr:MAG: hypothetical protein B6U83_04410 [Thermoplasmatales archaeon ex4484_36]
MRGELEVKLLKGGELEGLLTDEEAHFLFPSVWAAQDAQMRYVSFFSRGYFFKRRPQECSTQGLGRRRWTFS